MNPKLCKRFTGGRSISIGSESEIEKTSVRGDATLLLSIADICNSEIKTGGLTNLWRDDLTLPRFPCLTDKYNEPECKFLTPRTDSLRDFLSASGKETGSRTRLRSVSIDSPKRMIAVSDRDAISPLSFTSPNLVAPIVSPSRPSHRVMRKQGLRSSSANVRRIVEDAQKAEQEEDEEVAPSPMTPRRTKSLQGPSSPGCFIRRIGRKKFSWKNYPELEHFLIANREEYLRHSALNYTVQQKQYNNLLTDRLLELSTEHGYVFDEKEFNFVTVRDRIRCYYKSYVQSAKKRGVLMGYAARKAGLLTADDLLLEVDHGGRIIITP